MQSHSKRCIVREHRDGPQNDLQHNNRDRYARGTAKVGGMVVASYAQGQGNDQNRDQRSKETVRLLHQWVKTGNRTLRASAQWPTLTAHPRISHAHGTSKDNKSHCRNQSGNGYRTQPHNGHAPWTFRHQFGHNPPEPFATTNCGSPSEFQYGQWWRGDGSLRLGQKVPPPPISPWITVPVSAQHGSSSHLSHIAEEVGCRNPGLSQNSSSRR